jgi:DNA repair exonuclease SbcCD nuclease subunit
VFRRGPDVIPANAIPVGYAAVLAGHIHRRQVLRRAPNGRRMAAPILYPGSVERTSSAERDEPKGYMVIDMEAGSADGGRISAVRFRRLPTRNVNWDSRRVVAVPKASAGAAFAGRDRRRPR